ncbi:hypothetical protein BC941DRAFT_469013 [Chlamydoabsidia padenii]|nr:hypothetical protein BC941DRAFT_469013 [Chlamydoabsidia padenii]
MTANAQEFVIEMVPHYGVQLLRALLHSIFFHRLLVNVIPRDIRVLNATVSITNSQEVETLIENKSNEFIRSIHSNNKQGKIAVLFYEKRRKKT